MKEFSSLGEFGLHLLTLQLTEELALHKGLKRVADLVEATAKEEIGTYQPSVGPFGAWEKLTDSTEDEKSRLGYPLEAPLLRTGKTRDSISNIVDGLEAVIGSEEDILLWQELGTSTIPPRPVLGPAVVQNKKKIERILGDASAVGLIGGEVLPSELGYGEALEGNESVS